MTSVEGEIGNWKLAIGNSLWGRGWGKKKE